LDFGFVQRKRPRQKVAQVRFDHVSRLIGIDNIDCQLGIELEQHLPARAARHRPALCGDGKAFELPLASRNRRERSRPFGTDRQSVAGVFDITANERQASGGSQGRPDEEFRVRRVGLLAD
jgi:hypothetical protein